MIYKCVQFGRALRITSMVIFLFAASQQVCAQISTPGEQLATKQARRLKDSLGLSEVQYQEILQINLMIVQRKKEARQQAGGNIVLLSKKLQDEETKRDSLYKGILVPYIIFQKYKAKKDNLLSN